MVSDPVILLLDSPVVEGADLPQLLTAETRALIVDPVYKLNGYVPTKVERGMTHCVSEVLNPHFCKENHWP